MSEFSIALASGRSVLFPICLCRVADLPVFMTHNHMELCLKGDRARLREAVGKLVSQILGEDARR